MRKFLLPLLLFPLASFGAQQFIGAPVAGPVTAPVVNTDTLAIFRGSTFYSVTPQVLLQYLSNNMTGTCTLSGAFVISCPSGGAPGTPVYGLQFNNAGTFGSVLPSSTGVWCVNWTSLSAAPTLVPCTLDLIGSGTNNKMAGVITTGASLTTSGTGVISANQINAGVIPTSASLLGTNVAKQPIDIEPTAGGGIGVSNGQIFVNAIQPPTSTFSNLPACNSSVNGLLEQQTDANSFPPTRGSTAAGGGVNSWPVVCAGGASTWVYL